MVAVEPAALIVFPIAFVAALRQRWAFLFLVASVPFFTLEVVRAVSHPFNPPEIALLVLGGHVVGGWLRDREAIIRNAGPVLLLWGFVGAAALSVLWATIEPATVLVHPYGQPFQNRALVEADVGTHYLTQLLLRGLFVFAITAITVHLIRTDSVKMAVRGVVYGAVLTGAVGILYQLAAILDMTTLARSLQSFGFGSFRPTPIFIGPIPRMYSFPGEPGYTADFLLYGFSIVATASVLPGENWAFDRRETLALWTFLGGSLIMSTATTGYGGLVVMAGVLSVLVIAYPNARPPDLGEKLATAVVVGVGAVLLYIAAGTPLFDAITYQIEKMTFSAGSGDIRQYYITRSLDVFLNRPLLGAGVGSHSSPAYLPVLIAETGLIGALTLIGAHVWALRQSAALITGSDTAEARGGAILAVGGATLFGTNLVAKSIASLLMPWYWFSLALPIALVALYARPGNGLSVDFPDSKLRKSAARDGRAR